MAMTNKLFITLLLLVSIAFVHSLTFHVEVEEEFEPPQQEEQERPDPGGGSGEGWEEEPRENPYHFRKRSFKTRFQSKEGFMKTLPKFTKRSPFLFSGIENYRFWLMEMEPSTFLVPHHWDADSVVLVLQGQGVIEFVADSTNEAFHITRGDVVRVPSGVTHFLTNINQTVPLRLAKITVSVNIPGHVKDYFPAPSQLQQSYLSGFSKKVLSASFNLPEELIGRLVTRSKQMRQGIMRTVSPDQIKELTEHATSPSNKHKESMMLSPFNLLSQDPISSNDFGSFYEAHPKSFSQLQDLNISAAWCNMTQGSLFLPRYNTKSTFITFVENGCARFEMASPYTFQGEQQQWSGQRVEEEEDRGNIYKIVSHVCKGDVFISPPGYPLAVLSQDQDYVGIGFGIHAFYNTRMFLAGKENMLSNLNTVATRLTFGVENEVAQKLFTSQNYSYFAPTIPSHRKPPFQSII